MNREKCCKRCGGEPHAAPSLECPMDDAMWKALFRWQVENGYMWKSKLSRAWTKGQDVGEELLRVRNVVGAGGLYKIDLAAPKE